METLFSRNVLRWLILVLRVRFRFQLVFFIEKATNSRHLIEAHNTNLGFKFYYPQKWVIGEPVFYFQSEKLKPETKPAISSYHKASGSSCFSKHNALSLCSSIFSSIQQKYIFQHWLSLNPSSDCIRTSKLFPSGQNEREKWNTADKTLCQLVIYWWESPKGLGIPLCAKSTQVTKQKSTLSPIFQRLV